MINLPACLEVNPGETIYENRSKRFDMCGHDASIDANSVNRVEATPLTSGHIRLSKIDLIHTYLIRLP
jgi:hypothetical protein